METISSIMKSEHKNILLMLENVEKNIQQLEEGKDINIDFYQKVLTFLREYADDIHHAKEERILFVFIKEDETLTKEEEIERLVHQHFISRMHFEDIEKAMAHNNVSKLVKTFKEYIKMIRAHIHEEDEVLFPILESLLSDESKNIILQKFKDSDNQKDINKYLSLIYEAEEMAGNR